MNHLITLLGIAFFSIGSFLGLFYLLRNKLRDDGYLFLYITMLFIAYELFYKTLIHSKLILNFVDLYLPGRFYNLLLYPFFLFFVYSVTKSEFRLKVRHWLLLILFVCYIVIVNWYGMNLSLAEKQDMLNRFYEDKRPGSFDYWSTWETLLQSTLIPLCFLSLIGYEFSRFRRQYKDKAKQSLLNILLTVIVLFFFYNQFSNLFYQWFYKTTAWSMIEWPVDIVFLSAVLFLLSLIALLVNSGSTFLPPSKYLSSSLAPENYNDIVVKITTALQEEELYKQPGLSLQVLSKKVGSNPTYISQAVNHKLGISYNDFINRFRIEEAKLQLLDDNNLHLTIDGIATACGFHSKSTFYRAFKKETGLTPKQYIKTQRRSNL